MHIAVAVLLRRHQEAVEPPVVAADLAALRSELAQETPLLQQFMLGVLHSSAEAHSRLQQNLRELRPAGWASLLGLLGSATIVMVLLYREEYAPAPRPHRGVACPD